MNKFPKTLAGFYKQNFFRYYGKQWILWSIVFIGAFIGEKLFVPYYQKWFVELLENYGITYASLSPFIHFAVFCICFFAVLNVTFFVRQTIKDKLAPKTNNKISEDLYDYVYDQSVGFYTETMPGKISNQISLIAGGYVSVYTTIFGVMIGMLAALLINITFVINLNWFIALILILGTVFRVTWGLYRKNKIAKASKERSKFSSKLNGYLMDSISNFLIVKLFTNRKKENEIIAPIRNKNVKSQQESNRQMKLFWVFPSFIEDSFVIIVIFVCLLMFAQGKLKISDVVYITSIYSIISRMIWNFIWTLPDVVDSYSMASESYEKLIKPIEVADVPNAPELKVPHGRIEFRNVVFKYKRNQSYDDETDIKKSPKRKGIKPVLKDFSLTIKPGEKVGLVGTSGAGKTTLVNLLMRFYDPIKGGIYIDGQNIREVNQDSLRRNIAFIPQDPTMFNRTLKANIEYGGINATDKEIHTAARKAQAEKFILTTEKKYDSLVGDRGIKLSGGQRQRISIARAFLKNAPILILDEATSALDSETEAAVQTSFEELSVGRTTIAIAHRLSTLRYMDRIVVMGEQGRILEQGTHSQLLRKGGTYAKLWKMQVTNFLQG